jgi:beta-1,4-mannosyltransferase
LDDDSVTAFTEDLNGVVKQLTGRPALIISSTSWTSDEDFSMLLSALVKYDKEHTTDHPDIICAITGNGPQKSYYQCKIAELDMSHVKIITCWLEPEDYPRLLAASDLGVSLHFSSSGLDLPMKVVDMFAAGIPVCARNFKCLRELVIHGKNGCVFDDSDHLGRQFLTMFKKFGSKENKHLSILKTGVEHFRKLPWHYHWKHVALPVFDDKYVFEDYGSEEEDNIPYGGPSLGIPRNML